MCAHRIPTRLTAALATGFPEWLKEQEHRFGKLHTIHPAILESLSLWAHEVLLSSPGDPDLDEIEGAISRIFKMEGVVLFHLKACVSAAIEYCALSYGIENFGLRGKRDELVAWLNTTDLYASVDETRVRTAVTCLLDDLDAQFYKGIDFDQDGFSDRLRTAGLGQPHEEWLDWLAVDALTYLDTEGFIQETGF